MSKSATCTAAQQRALELLIDEWAVLGYLRLSAVHVSNLKALVANGFLAPQTHTITAAGLKALGYWGPEIDALGPAIERAKTEADRVRGIRAELRVAMDREAQAERTAAAARDAARAAVRVQREARHV